MRSKDCIHPLPEFWTKGGTLIWVLITGVKDAEYSISGIFSGLDSWEIERRLPRKEKMVDYIFSGLISLCPFDSLMSFFKELISGARYLISTCQQVTRKLINIHNFAAFLMSMNHRRFMCTWLPLLGAVYCIYIVSSTFWGSSMRCPWKIGLHVSKLITWISRQIRQKCSFDAWLHSAIIFLYNLHSSLPVVIRNQHVQNEYKSYWKVCNQSKMPISSY